MRMHSLKILLPIAIMLFGASCDREHQKKCEWELEPDPGRINRVEPGYVPVCARNRKINKQDCRLQTTLEFAKKIEGRKFRYVDLKVKTFGIPRTIQSIDVCD